MVVVKMGVNIYSNGSEVEGEHDTAVRKKEKE